MAIIEKTYVYGAGAVTVKVTVLDGQDTFLFNPDATSCLVLKNTTGIAREVNIDGDGVAPVDVDGIGEVDVTAGYDTGQILPGEIKVIRLNKIYEYLKGNISVTGGAGMQAYILELL